MKTTTIQVQGMHCKSCEMLITDALEEMTGVHKVNVSANHGRAVIEHNDSVSEKKLRGAIEAEGYKTA